MRRLALPLVVSLALGCAGTGKLSLRPGYDFKKMRKVAVVSFRDARNLPDSGMIISDMIAETLSASGLQVIERSRVEAVVAKIKFDFSGPIPRAVAQEIGRTLGVDAVVVGGLSARIKPERTTVRSARGGKITVRRNGRFQRVFYPRRPGPGEVKTYETEGDVALDVNVHMVGVKTGEVVWIVAGHAEKRGFQSAVEAALTGVMSRLKKRIQRSLQGKAVRPDAQRRGLELSGWDY